MSTDNQPDHSESSPCIICHRPVIGYVSQFCCSGRECGCMGAPIEPCCCSVECERAVYDFIGKPFEQRRQLAGIEKWTKGEKAMSEQPDHSADTNMVLLPSENMQICTVCNRIGTVGRCCGRDTHRDATEADISTWHPINPADPSTLPTEADADERLELHTRDIRGIIGITPLHNVLINSEWFTHWAPRIKQVPPVWEGET